MCTAVSGQKSTPGQPEISLGRNSCYSGFRLIVGCSCRGVGSPTPVFWSDGVKSVDGELAVERLQSGSGNVELTYDSLDEDPEDAVKVTGLEVDITRVPDYLFANACYATPLKFDIKGADNVPLETVKVSFLAEGDEKLSDIDLSDRTMILEGEDAGKPADEQGEDGQRVEGKVFEAYLQSKKLRTFTLEDGHTTQNARFEVEVSFPASHPASAAGDICSESQDQEARVSEKFYDKKVAAFDIREGANATHLIETSLGAFCDESGRQRTTLVEWDQLRENVWVPTEEPGMYKTKRLFWHNPAGLYAPGSVAPEHEQWMTTCLEPPLGLEYLYRMAYDRPYWKGNPEIGGLEVTVDVDDPGSLKWERKDWDWASGRAFETCEYTKGIENETLQSHVDLRQKWHNYYYGTYAARNIGIRYGGAFFVSYPGKSVAVLEGNEVTVPKSNTSIAEKAMDLGRSHVVATGEIRCASGNWYVKSIAKKEGSDVLPVASDALAIGAAIPNPASPYFAVASAGLALFDAAAGSGDNGKSMARIQQWYSINGDGSDGKPISQDVFQINNNRGEIPPTAKTPETGPKNIQVGQQLSSWVDFISQAQLRAQDTYLGWGVYECRAIVQCEFDSTNEGDKIQVKLYITGDSGN